MDYLSQLRPCIDIKNLSPDLLHALLSSTRIMESLCDQLEYLRTLYNIPGATGALVESAYRKLTHFLVNYTKAFLGFLCCVRPIIETTPVLKSALRPLLATSLDYSLLVELQDRCTMLLAYGLTKSCFMNCEPTAPTIERYGLNLSASFELLQWKEPSNYIRHLGRVISSGVWISPYISSIEQVLNIRKHGGDTIESGCEHSLLSASMWTRAVEALPGDEHWHIYAETAECLADKEFQETITDLFSRVHQWVLAQKEEIDPNAINGALMTPLMGYAALLEGSRAQAEVTGVRFDWSMVARSISRIGDVFLEFSNVQMPLSEGLPKTSSSSTHTPTPESLIHLAASQLAPSFARFARFVKLNYDPQKRVLDREEDIIPVLQSAERLVTILATAPRFAAFAGKYKEFETLMANTVGLANLLLSLCANSVDWTEHGKSSWWKKVTSTALEALQTVGKALVLLNQLPAEVRQRLLPVPQYLESSGMGTQNWLTRQISCLVQPLLKIIGDASRSMKNQEQKQDFMACALLTVSTSFTAIERPDIDIAETVQIYYGWKLSDWSAALTKCVLPSDHPGRKKSEPTDENTRPNDTSKLAAVHTGMVDIIKSAGDCADPGRLVIRSRVLGHRLCGHMRCTKLRPSLEKPFGKLCAGCKTARYCCVQHQKSDWA